MKTLGVDLGERSYEIKIGRNLLTDLAKYLLELGFSEQTKVLVITDQRVEKLYAEQVEQALNQVGFSFKITAVPEGEASKSLDMAKKLYDEAIDFGLERSSLVVALGGGVVGDLAGFIAATYMRGVPFIQVPTTLLAQVDSSVGGKVAVNHSAGKNLIGAFYQPRLVLIDIEVLRTLEQRDFRSGMAEVIKYGMIWDRHFFDYLVDYSAEIRGFQSAALAKMIYRSCEIKAEVVAEDEKELGLRAILNYGHTIGHAIEALTEYGEYRHGEAVSIGMVCAMELAYRLDRVDKSAVELQRELIESFQLPTAIEDLNIQQIIAKTKQDKKVERGEVKFILPQQIGEVEIVGGIDTELIEQVLQNNLA
ncbi:3-dehydroquinate synthase [Fuchsiella alkaliacetigena]|uniref:3-dehydroquinate synthase n=1 Tax=Fuchsiella alkaliacetigena TaxID=957042 RepID=UPI00200B4EBB|nr:3-dehydroquinate synthase [Fuchsiella alkaliacetigena]MCK8825294.1 3-dehydroquinate synthase [Fuchsiella alkaliacetigena]